ncbi:MAG: class I tRNA ligase family protein, partial [Methanobacteriota archaeon]
EIISLPDSKVSNFDQPARWMLSRLQEQVKATTEAFDGFETRKAAQHAFFMLMQDVRWYIKRETTPEVRAHILKRVLDSWLRLLTPLTPHICEELWKKSGKNGFISTATWPSIEQGLLNKEAEFAESYILRVLEDVGKIIKVMKSSSPRKVCLYVAQDWKWRAYRIAMEHTRAGFVDMGKLLRTVEKELGLRIQKADLAKYLQKTVQELRKMPVQEIDTIASTEVYELQILKEAADFIRSELGVNEIQVFKADDQARYDPQNRAIMSVPLRPAIYLER